MENKIDSRYFHSLIELPLSLTQAENGTPSDGAIDDFMSRLDQQIAKHQKKLLIKLFGSDIIPESVLELIVDENTLTSPIANYVYCNVITAYQSNSTDSGEKIHSAETSISISVKNKMDEAWNDMVEMLGDIRESLYNNGLEAIYPTDYNSEIYKLSYFI